MIFSDRKYSKGTFFYVLSALINQCSGINAINVYSSEILLGIPGLPVIVGVYLLSVANVVGACIGPLIQKFISIKTIIVCGQFSTALCNGGVILFTILEMPLFVLVCMILIIVSYQMSMGSYYFVYVS